MQSVQAVVTDHGVPAWNKLRVVMLYALRYQKTQTANIAALINLMLANGVSREDARVRFIVMICTLANGILACICHVKRCWVGSAPG